MSIQPHRPEAWRDGEPVSVEAAAQDAAELLSQSRQALFFGMGADVEGTRAAVELARRIGGVIDHAHSARLLRDLVWASESGVMLTTPGEARARADFVLLVGDDPGSAWPRMSAGLLASPARPDGVDIRRRIVWLAPRAKDRIANSPGEIETIAAGRGVALAENLAALRAHVKGRAVSWARRADLKRLAEELLQARFGVALWSSPDIEPLAVAMLNGLTRDLSEKTRFCALPLAPPENAAGVMMTCGWLTGFPVRIGFGGGVSAYDPWRFEAQRLLASGEADCALWISSFGSAPPSWAAGAPLIALSTREAVFANEPRVRFAVGRPGVDHDAVLHSPDTGTLVAVTASARSPALSVAAALRKIAEYCDAGAAAQC